MMIAENTFRVVCPKCGTSNDVPFGDALTIETECVECNLKFVVKRKPLTNTRQHITGTRFEIIMDVMESKYAKTKH